MDEQETLPEEPTFAVVPAWDLRMAAEETIVIFQSLRTHLRSMEAIDR